MKLNKIKLKFISITIFIFVVIFITFLLQNKKTESSTPSPINPLESIGSIPTNNASGVSLFDPIVITFNQRVEPQNISITSEPQEDWTLSQNVSNILTVNHNLALRVATPYKLTIKQNNNVVGILSFETAHEQNDPRMLQLLDQEFEKNYPLASLVPYETNDFKVVYSAPLTFNIQIKSSITTQDVISQVQSWVETNGINYTTHKYNIVK